MAVSVGLSGLQSPFLLMQLFLLVKLLLQNKTSSANRVKINNIFHTTCLSNMSFCHVQHVQYQCVQHVQFTTNLPDSPQEGLDI